MVDVFFFALFVVVFYFLVFAASVVYHMLWPKNVAYHVSYVYKIDSNHGYGEIRIESSSPIPRMSELKQTREIIANEFKKEYPLLEDTEANIIILNVQRFPL